MSFFLFKGHFFSHFLFLPPFYTNIQKSPPWFRTIKLWASPRRGHISYFSLFSSSTAVHHICTWIWIVSEVIPKRHYVCHIYYMIAINVCCPLIRNRICTWIWIVSDVITSVISISPSSLTSPHIPTCGAGIVRFCSNKPPSVMFPGVTVTARLPLSLALKFSTSPSLTLHEEVIT